MIKFTDLPKIMKTWNFTRKAKIELAYQKQLTRLNNQNKLDDQIINECYQGKKINIVKNAFPYDIEADHYVCWYLPTSNMQEVYMEIREFVGDRRAYWGESLKKSIPKFPHIHIFIDKNKKIGN